MKVIQSKRTQTRFSESVIWQGDRVRDARGQIKMVFNSTLGMLVSHHMFNGDIDIDEENQTISIIDGDMIFQMSWRIEDAV